MKFPRPARHHVVAVALLAVLAGASLLLRGPVQGTDPSSTPTTYSTEPGGLQGLFMTCDALGIAASRFTGRLEDVESGAVPALVVAGRPAAGVDPGLLVAWVEGGGRLLLAGTEDGVLERFSLRTEWAPNGSAAWFPPGGGWKIPEGVGPPHQRLLGEGVRGARVLARFGGATGDPWILEIRRGAGSVLVLADAGPLSNAGIEAPANAVLAVRLLEAVARDGPVEFCETWHGYGGSGDPDAAMARILLHTPFGNAALGAGLFGLLFLVAGASRFGRVRRFLEPKRRSEYEYLDALAGLLVRAKAWPEAGRLLLHGAVRRSGREGRRGDRLPIGELADALAWDKPEAAASFREGAQALARGVDPRAMARGLGVLDGGLPPERAHAGEQRSPKRKGERT